MLIGCFFWVRLSEMGIERFRKPQVGGSIPLAGSMAYDACDRSGQQMGVQIDGAVINAGLKSITFMNCSGC
jgi:hypothetical protein